VLGGGQVHDRHGQISQAHDVFARVSSLGDVNFFVGEARFIERAECCFALHAGGFCVDGDSGHPADPSQCRAAVAAATWRVGPLTRSGGTVAITQVLEDGHGMSSQHALAVRSNIIIDVAASRDDTTNQALDILTGKIRP
jgi:PknH-like extracellular domain